MVSSALEFHFQAFFLPLFPVRIRIHLLLVSSIRIRILLLPVSSIRAGA